MKKIFVLLSIIFIASACSRNSETENPTNAINIDGLLTVKVQDNSGKNVSEAFGNNLKITYSEPATVSSGYFADFPEHFKMQTDGEGNKSIGVFLNLGDTNSTAAETVLLWKDGSSDTVNAFIERGNSYAKVTKVYLNGALMWEEPKLQNTSMRAITIKK